MNHIVSFSSGLSSALTVERVINKFKGDPDNPVHIVFMDTLIEDDDNYRFMAECANRWRELYGEEVITLTEGRTPYQVFTDQHVIPNNRVAPCTRRLKIEMFVDYLKQNFTGQDVTIHIGYDYSELHRCEATTKNYAKHGWTVDFPLMWKPIEYRPYQEVVLNDWGIKAPRMYSMGYSHANCGGRCVKQGKNDWIRTLVNFPERYAEVEQWEQEMRKNEVNSNYTLAKKVVKGESIHITLKDLREEYESKPDISKFCDIENEQCVVCGVGDLMA